MSSSQSISTIPTLMMGLHCIREIAPEMPIGILLSLLAVAQYSPRKEQDPRDQLSLQQIAEVAGIPYTSMSRHLRYLGEMERPGVPGLGLVDVAELIIDRRQKGAYLTHKGNRLMEQFFTLTGVVYNGRS